MAPAPTDCTVTAPWEKRTQVQVANWWEGRCFNYLLVLAIPPVFRLFTYLLVTFVYELRLHIPFTRLSKRLLSVTLRLYFVYLREGLCQALFTLCCCMLHPELYFWKATCCR